MKWLKNLFSKNPTAPPSGATTEEMRNDPNLVAVFDEYGRELFISKETWRTDVLPGTLENLWDDPDQLYGLIIGTLNDGFHEDVLEAAYQLQKIHPSPQVGSTVLSIVLVKNGRLDDAEETLQSCMADHGRDGVLLTNLAKVYAERGDQALCEQTLWAGLQEDPNQDNGVDWWTAIRREQDGPEGYERALRDVAAIDGSWYPRLFLARIALEQGRLDEAMSEYEVVLRRCDPLSAETMTQISGDLGNAGHLREIVGLLGDRFDAERHGLSGGSNLLRACVELGERKRAAAILGALFAQGRHDWAEHLSYWEDQLDQASDKYGPVEEGVPDVVVLTVDDPVWTMKLKGRDDLLPAKAPDAQCVAFVSLSCATPDPKAEIRRSDREGTLSRGIPLFLSETVTMRTDASGRMLVPVIEESGSFVLSGAPWPRNTLDSMMGEPRPTVLVTGHLDATADSWIVTLEILSPSDLEGDPLATVDATVDPSQPAAGLAEICEKTMDALRRHCQLKDAAPAIPYNTPDDVYRYVDGLTGSLALSVATSDGFDGSSLYGERNILDDLLRMALDHPDDPVCQLLFVGALSKNRNYGSQIYLEYQHKAEKLLDEHAQDGPAAVAARTSLDGLFAD